MREVLLGKPLPGEEPKFAARTSDGLPPLIVGMGRGSVLLKRHNDLVEAMRITPEEIQTAIERIREGVEVIFDDGREV